MIPHIEESGEACIIVAISTEGRKKAAAVMGTVSLGNKSIKGVAKVREANKDKPPLQEKSPLQKFMEQTPKIITPRDIIVKSELVTGRRVAVTIHKGHIGITVDGSYVREDNSPKDGAKVAIRALRIVQAEAAKMPDGTLLTGFPSSSDGLGEARVSLYGRAGFGPIDGGMMMSVVKNGKLTRISAEQEKYLMDNGHFNRG